MLVKIRLTRAQNAQAYGVPVGNVVAVGLETYLLGVVPSEVYESRTPDEALKAQSIASRTYAMRKSMDGLTLTDTSTHQSYDATRATTSPRSKAAVDATRGLVLLYDGQPIHAYYSRSNGGWTRRTEDVWSAALPYYQSRIDHWDAAAVAEALNRGTTITPSHGVGMSQVGAEYAAKQGVSCADILAFYYPGADVGRYGGDQQMAKPKARAVCATARKCATQTPPIPYVWGKESATQQDCQGHIEYCVRANGGTMSYAGSNDMLRNACSWVGTLAEARAQGKLIPGALLFQVKPGGDYPAKYHGDGKGNAQHVGMYIGDPDIEITHASSSAGRVTTSTFKSTWTHVGLAKAIDYSDALGAVPDIGNPTSENAVLGIIATQKDPLNMRVLPNTSSTVVCKIPRGAQVVLTETATVGGVLWGRTTWTQGGILYGGWVCMDYVTLIREEPTQTTIIVAVPVATQAHADQLLAAYPGAYVI